MNTPGSEYKEDVITLDSSEDNADWTKQSWDLPPYLSPEFNAIVTDLNAFKELPIYKRAVETGLIIDDEWAADYIEPTEKPDGMERRR